MQATSRTISQAVFLLLIATAPAAAQANSPGVPKPPIIGGVPTGGGAQSDGTPGLKQPPSASPRPQGSPDDSAPPTSNVRACDVAGWMAKLDARILQAIQEHLVSDEAKRGFAKNEPSKCPRDSVSYHLNVLGQMLSDTN